MERKVSVYPFPFGTRVFIHRNGVIREAEYRGMRIKDTGICGKNGDTSKVEIDYGASSVYSKAEIDSAIEIIKKQFASFEGCELHSLSYMPDEECNNADNIEWMNNLRTDDNKEAFTQCIAFESSFRSPKKGGGAWEANEEYTWSWWLARSEGGEWNLMTWGY